jgi:hypothetical protein
VSSEWPETSTCQWCGEVFTAPPIKAHGERFCRQECLTAYRALRIRQAGNMRAVDATASTEKP